MARQFGIELIVDDKGTVAVLDRASGKLRDLGSAATIASTQVSTVPRSLVPANQALDKLRDSSEVAGAQMAKASTQMAQIALSGNPAAAATAVLASNLQQLAEKALVSKEAIAFLGPNWQKAAGAAGMAAAAGAAAGAVIGGTVIKVAEFAKAVADLSEEQKALSVSLNNARQETAKQEDIFHRVAAATKQSDAELRAMFPTLAELVEYAKRNPGSDIAAGLDKVSTAAVAAKTATDALAESQKNMADIRAAAKEEDAWNKWAKQVAATAKSMGAASIATGLVEVAAVKASTEIKKLVLGPGLAADIYKARDATNAASDAAIKAVGDYNMLNGAVVAAAREGAAQLAKMNDAMAKLRETAFSFALPSEIANVSDAAKAKGVARVDSIAKAASGGLQTNIAAAKEAVAAGDVGALKAVIEALLQQQDLARNFGGARGDGGAGSVAFGLQDVLRTLEASVKAQPAATASAVKMAMSGLSIKVDRAHLGEVVADAWGRGLVPTAPAFG